MVRTDDSRIGYREGGLHVEDLAGEEIARRFGTPTYVYSGDQIERNFRRLVKAFEPVRLHVAYAVKACGNPHVLRLVASLGAGMDVVSGGELERVYMAGIDVGRVTFAGTGKTEAEIRAGISGRHSLVRGRSREEQDSLARRGPIAMFNVECEGELERISLAASEAGVRVRCCLRVNPNVDARTHRYTTTGKHENKFGVGVGRAPEIVRAWRGHPWVEFVGLHFHLGSPIASPEPYAEALGVVFEAMDRIDADGTRLSVLNIGGGFAIDYGDAPTGIATPEEFGAALVPLLEPRAREGLRIHMEPGRVIVGSAGVLLTRVQYVKASGRKLFAVCDAGIHCLVRPALYGAYHFVWPANPGERWEPLGKSPRQSHPGLVPVDVVGPICESSDFLAQDRLLPPVAPGDLLAVFDVGAYGMSMSSTYNDQPKPAEVFVRGERAELATPRQEIADVLGPGVHGLSVEDRS